MKPCACAAAHHRRRIVLTGGPGAGKTAVRCQVTHPEARPRLGYDEAPEDDARHPSKCDRNAVCVTTRRRSDRSRLDGDSGSMPVDPNRPDGKHPQTERRPCHDLRTRRRRTKGTP